MSYTILNAIFKVYHIFNIKKERHMPYTKLIHYLEPVL